jgi:5-methylcytosine-specific restriction endonuclease McrA
MKKEKMFYKFEVNNIRKKIASIVDSAAEASKLVEELQQTDWQAFLEVPRSPTSGEMCTEAATTAISQRQIPVPSKQAQMVADYCNQEGIESSHLRNMLQRAQSTRSRVKETSRIKTRETEQEIIKCHLDRARAAGLPATLTQEEWIETLDYYAWQCAYCKRNKYMSMDHFIPIILKGGTTQQNVVPSCKSCNAKKGRFHPDHVNALPQEVIQEVKNYLAAKAS